MSFSTNAADWSYNDCSFEYPNGTWIFYNFSSPSLPNCNCIAAFQADPDIAGPGVSNPHSVTTFSVIKPFRSYLHSF